MHALFVTVSIDPAGMNEAVEALNSQVVPGVKQAPGFVAGYWFAPEQKGAALEGSSVVVFDSEAKLDLGGVTAHLLWFGAGHTKGDELITHLGAEYYD